MVRKEETSAWFSRIPVVTLALVLMGACMTSQADAGPGYVDLELVLAVDGSDSMSRAEMLIQRNGYIAALRSADVAAAIASRGAVALAYMEWAGPRSQKVVVPWTVLSDANDSALFADLLAAAPLIPFYEAVPWERGTSISHALLFAAGMFSPGRGASRVIDISGDGPQNSGGDLYAARDRVVAEGVVINGLPIIISPAAAWRVPLGTYYEDCVIGGPGAFVITVDNASLLALAIRRKLVLEIAGPPPRLIHADFRPDERSQTDCMVLGQRLGR
jgi:hypothetical protein